MPNDPELFTRRSDMIPVLVSMTRTTTDLPSVKRLLLYDLSSPTTAVQKCSPGPCYGRGDFACLRKLLR